MLLEIGFQLLRVTLGDIAAENERIARGRDLVESPIAFRLHHEVILQKFQIGIILLAGLDILFRLQDASVAVAQMLIDLLFTRLGRNGRDIGRILKADPSQGVGHLIGVLLHRKDKDAGLVFITGDDLDVDPLYLGDQLGELRHDVCRGFRLGKLSDERGGGRGTGEIHRHIEAQPRLDRFKLRLILDLFRFVHIDILLIRYNIVSNTKGILCVVDHPVIVIGRQPFPTFEGRQQSFLLRCIAREDVERLAGCCGGTMILRLQR